MRSDTKVSILGFYFFFFTVRRISSLSRTRLYYASVVTNYAAPLYLKSAAGKRAITQIQWLSSK